MSLTLWVVIIGGAILVGVVSLIGVVLGRRRQIRSHVVRGLQWNPLSFDECHFPIGGSSRRSSRDDTPLYNSVLMGNALHPASPAWHSSDAPHQQSANPDPSPTPDSDTSSHDSDSGSDSGGDSGGGDGGGD